MSLLGIFSILGTCLQGIKEACEPTIPAENWSNKELIHQDRVGIIVKGNRCIK